MNTPPAERRACGIEKPPERVQRLQLTQLGRGRRRARRRRRDRFSLDGLRPRSRPRKRPRPRKGNSRNGRAFGSPPPWTMGGGLMKQSVKPREPVMERDGVECWRIGRGRRRDRVSLDGLRPRSRPRKRPRPRKGNSRNGRAFGSPPPWTMGGGLMKQSVKPREPGRARGRVEWWRIGRGRRRERGRRGGRCSRDGRRKRSRPRKGHSRKDR